MVSNIARPLVKAQHMASMIKLEHSIFALPLAYTGALLGAGGFPTTRQAIWILAAMFGARTAAMSFNRLIDRAIDAANPRTKGRHLPSGIVAPGEAFALGTGSLGLLILSAWMLNPLCVFFLPLVVPALVLYPYTKRFTWGCHLALGVAQFFASFGGWIAITGRIDSGAILLGIVSMLWVAGFDVIYATLDVEFDKAYGIHSMPSRFGIPTALWLSRCMHALALAALLGVYITVGLGVYFLAGTIVVAGLLFYEHCLVSPRDLTRVSAAFQNVNLVVGVVILVATMLEVTFTG